MKSGVQESGSPPGLRPSMALPISENPRFFTAEWPGQDDILAKKGDLLPVKPRFAKVEGSLPPCLPLLRSIPWKPEIPG